MALSTVFWIIAIIVLIATVITIIIVAVKTRKETLTEIPDNASKIRNYWSSATNGYAEGFEISKKDGRNGRIICKFIPTDIDVNEKRDLTPQTIVLSRGARVVIPDLSSKRQLVEYYPNKIKELPRGFMRTEKGRIAQDFITKLNQINTEEEYLQKGLDTQKEMVMKRPLGEMTKTELNLQDFFIKRLNKLREEGDKFGRD